MARTDARRLWIGGGAVAAVLLAVASWTFVVSPKLSQANDLHSQAQDTQLRNLSLQADVGRLRAAYAKLGGLRTQRQAARMALPTDNALALFTRQVAAQAQAAQVRVGQLTAGAPTPVGPDGSTAIPTAPATAPSSSAAAPATTPSTAGSTPPSGLYAIPITLMVTGSPAADVRFLDAVQHRGPRAILMSTTQLTAASAVPTGGTGSSGTGAMSLTATLEIFAEPLSTSAASPVALPASTSAPSGP